MEAAGFDLRHLPEGTRDYVGRVCALHDAYLATADRPGPDLAAGTTASSSPAAALLALFVEGAHRVLDLAGVTI